MVGPEEAEALCELAGSWNLTPQQAAQIHRHDMSDLVSVAMADGVLLGRSMRTFVASLRCSASIVRLCWMN